MVTMLETQGGKLSLLGLQATRESSLLSLNIRLGSDDEC